MYTYKFGWILTGPLIFVDVFHFFDNEEYYNLLYNPKQPELFYVIFTAHVETPLRYVQSEKVISWSSFFETLQRFSPLRLCAGSEVMQRIPLGRYRGARTTGHIQSFVIHYH